MPTLLSEKPRLSSLQARVSRVVEMAATPLLPSDYIDLINPLASPSELRGRILTVVPETNDATTLVIKPGRGWQGHVPGQYVRVGVDIEGVRYWRAYSITSPPGRADGRFSITVKAIPDGLVSNYLAHRVTSGTVIQLDQACGEFTLGETTPPKVLFVTAGSGITPVIGMLRSSDFVMENAIVVHSSPRRQDVIFGSELRRHADSGHIRLFERHTDDQGFLDAGELARLVPDLAEREVWACGPTGVLDMLEELFEAIGRPEQIHTERFRPTAIVAGDGGQVTFTESETSVEADGATPLLDVGEESGVLMPSGCRMGICFGCVAKLREGAVRDLRTGEVTTSSNGEEVRIQTCVSAAAGQCEIEL